MAVFGVQTNGEVKTVNEYFRDTSKRLMNDNLVENPFVGGVKKYRVSSIKQLMVFDIVPIYPNFTFFGWLVLLPMLLFLGVSWWLLIPFGILFLGFLWTSRFYYFFVKLGLRKAGYSGPVKFLDSKGIVKQVIFNEMKRQYKQFKS